MNAFMKYCSCVFIASLHLTVVPCFAQRELSLDARLSRGDASAIQEVAESRSMDYLLEILFGAIRGQYGDRSDALREISAESIRKIPNYAASFGDEIDSLSQMKGTGVMIEHQFMMLEAIGSPEAIAEIGRFVHDDRDPDKEMYPPQSGYAGLSNSFLSCRIIGSLIGDRAPKETKAGFYGWIDVRAIQEWWDSPASSEYRASLPPARAAIRVKRPFRGESLPDTGKAVEPAASVNQAFPGVEAAPAPAIEGLRRVDSEKR